MQEIELKFQVAPAQRAAVAAAVGTRTAQATHLQAIYFDTPERHLAKAGIALRLRKEGRRWVQTFKSAGSDAMTRVEHNVMLAAGKPAELDLRRHDGTPAAALLDEALPTVDADDVAAISRRGLAERFRTDIRRVHRVLRARGGTVELAFDSGRIVGGGTWLPVCELEIELLRGDPAAVIDVARRWVRRYGLWLDVRSKAERGDRLARGKTTSSPKRADDSPLTRGMSLADAWRSATRDCLAQALPNASEIAAGSHTEEHVHQLRVALRRLRSLMRFLDHDGLGLDADAAAEVAKLFAALGAARDRDALAAGLLPELRKAGAPLVTLPPATDAIAPQALLAAPEASLLWLALLAAGSAPVAPALPVSAALASAPWKLGADTASTASLSADATTASVGDESPSVEEPTELIEPPLKLKDFAARRLKRWHRRMTSRADTFADLGDDERHSLRKLAKRLRYAAEFVAPLFPRKRVERYLKRLRALQEQLGHYNDLHVAELAYRQLVGTDGRAWFALGWLASRREVVLKDCAAALQRYARVEPFWRD